MAVQGCKNYWLNLDNQTLQSNDKRFAVGIGAMFGTNGMFGGSMEFLNLRDLNFNDSPQQAFTLFWHPLKLNPDGSVTTGNNPTSEHGLDYIFTNAWHTERAGTLSRPQLYLEPSPRPTNTFKGGQIWFETNSVKSDMMFSPTNGVVFPIPQLNQSNATVTAAFTFTWTFVYPFSDTNYSVSVSGGGTTLSNPAIGAKTTTNVVVTFSSFTGILNLMAVRQ